MNSDELPAWVKRLPWARAAGWVGILAGAYFFRRFVLVALVTFALTWAVRRLVVSVLARWPAARDRPAVERGLTFAGFAAVLAALTSTWVLVAPPLYEQSRKLVARVVYFDYRNDLDYFLARTVGSYLFHQKYGNETSPAYQQALRQFREAGHDGRGWFEHFPVMRAGLIAGFEARHADESLRALQRELARKPADDALVARLDQLRRAPVYRAAFRDYFDRVRADDPANYPFDFDRFTELEAAHVRGKAAFAEVLAKSEASPAADFEHGEQRRLARAWWDSSPMALAVRQRIGDLAPVLLGDLGGWVSALAASLVTVPIDLLTGFFLAIYVALDVHNLRRGFHEWGRTPVGAVFEAVWPDLQLFARVFGDYFKARTWIAVFDSVSMLILLWLLGVDNAVLLAAIVFVTSYVPYLGAVLAGVPIVLVAVIQPGGSFALALKAAAAMTAIHLIEANVVGPWMFARSVELHPITGIVALVLGEYWFGFWGLVFAVPVTVFLLRLEPWARPRPVEDAM